MNRFPIPGAAATYDESIKDREQNLASGGCPAAIIEEIKSMADDRFPNDPYRPNLADDEYRNAARRDAQLQVDPELGEGPASSGKVALFAVAIALVLGAVFYGLNNTGSSNQASTTPATQTAQQAPATNPAAP